MQFSTLFAVVAALAASDVMAVPAGSVENNAGDKRFLNLGGLFGSTTTTQTKDCAPAGQSLNGYTSMGCFRDTICGVLPYSYTDTSLTMDKCLTSCTNKGYAYGGVKAGVNCYCGNEVNGGYKTLDLFCTVPCAGNWGQNCGGLLSIALYDGRAKLAAINAAKSSSAAAYSASVSASNAAYSAGVASKSAAAYSASSSLAAYSARQSASAYSAQSAAAYSQSAAAYSAAQSAAAYSAASAAAYSAAQSAAAYSARSAAAYSAASSAAAYSAAQSAAAYSAQSAAAYSQSAAAYSAAQSAAAYSAQSAAAYSQSAAAYSAAQSEAAYSAAQSAAAYSASSAAAYSAQSAAAYSQSAADYSAAQSVAAYSAAQSAAAYSAAQSAAAYSAAQSEAAYSAAQSAAAYSASSAAAYSASSAAAYSASSAAAAAASSAAPSSAALPSGWKASNAAGICVKEAASGRALAGAKLHADDMTVNKCINYCSSKGFRYSGLEYGRECWCGNDFANGASLDNTTPCSTPCVGDSTQICGGGNSLSVYESTTITDTVNAVVGSFKKQGCIKEVSGRALTGASTTGDDMTLEKCTSFCQNAGFGLAGLEYGRECYCGNSFSNGASLSSTSEQCFMQCAGSPSQTCGGPSAIDLYATDSAIAGLNASG